MRRWLSSARSGTRRGTHRSLVAMVCATMVVAGCADFESTAPAESWTPAPTLRPQAGPQPRVPGAGSSDSGIPGSSGKQPPRQTTIPPPDGCTDHDRMVIATCLDTVSTVAALPTGGNTVRVLAGERDSGRVYTVSPDHEKTQIANLDVASGDGGGLTALAPSPTYRQDQLIFAYITTEEDNRVVRFAEGQSVEPVLTGIPKGPEHNAGALRVDESGALFVATGDAGDDQAASEDDSLAGKILRINTSGEPAEGNPREDSPVIAAGLHNPGGLCTPQRDTTENPERQRGETHVWVTDRQQDQGAVYRVEPGETLDSPTWTWPDKPGLAGCVAWSGVLSIATSTAGNIQNLPISEDGSVTGKPKATFGKDSARHYGKLAGMDLVSPKIAVVGTINKAGGDPVSSDDRVVLIPRTATPTAGRS